MEENAQTISKYPRFVFSEETDRDSALNHQEGGPKCPFCQEKLLVQEDSDSYDPEHSTYWEYCCGDDNCTFYLSEDTRNVYNALRGAYSLDEAVSMILEYCQEETDTRFKVTDRSSANWVLKKMAQAAAEMTDIDKMCDDEIAVINRRREQLKKSPQGTLNFFSIAYKDQLEQFARAELEGQKKKSIPLIYGMIGFRSSADKLVAVDETKAIKWAEEHAPEAVKKSLLISKIPVSAIPESDGAFDIAVSPDRFYIDAKIPEVK